MTTVAGKNFCREVAALLERGVLGEALAVIEDWVVEEPLNAEAFAALEQVRRRRGEVGMAEVAAKRGRQLQQIEGSERESLAAARMRSICGQQDGVGWEWNGLVFGALVSERVGERRVWAGLSTDGSARLEVRPVAEPAAEAILEALGQAQCQSCPTLLGSGEVETEELAGLCGEGDVGGESGERLFYRVVRPLRADRGGLGWGEVVLSLLEQQALGIYVGDVSLANLCWDSVGGVCRFADYGKARWLGETERKLAPRAYVDWCIEEEAKRLAAEGGDSFFRGRGVMPEGLWDGDRFRLVYAQLYHKQRLKILREPSVQSVEASKCVLEGSIPTGRLAAEIDALEPEAGETVWDIGCGLGEHCRRLARRGARVIGWDAEERVARGAQMIQNLEQLPGAFRCLDVDFAEPEGEAETVLLLSVLHHCQYPREVLRKLGRHCRRRVVIEAGLNEVGQKWHGSWYRGIPGWGLTDNGALVDFVGEALAGFRLVCGPVATERGRFWMVWEREGAQS